MKSSHALALAVSITLAGTAGASFAQEQVASGIGITAKAGLLGVGADLSIPFSESFNVRAGLSRWRATKDVTESDVNYSGTLTLGGAMLVADWFPFGGAFRLSAGVVKNNSKVEVNAKPGGSVTYNGVTYSASDLAVQGKISYDKTAPYVGFGWGNPSARSTFGMFVEVGAIKQSPVASLEGSCPSCGGTFASDLAVERQQLKDDAADIKWFPVVQVGLTYHF